MTADWSRHQGDANDFLIARIDGVDDLASVTAVTASVRFAGGSPVVLTAAVLDTAARTVRVSLSPWIATAALGCWRLGIHLTFTGPVGSLTWPEPRYGPAEIEVGPPV